MKSIGRRLDEHLAQYEPVPFDWATNNCIHFAYQWYSFLRQEGGSISLPPFEGKAMSRRFLLECQKSFPEMVSAFPNLTKIEVSFARIGDIVMYTIPDKDVQVLGIYIGPQTMFLGEDGQIAKGIVTISHAWRISYAA